MTTKNGTLIMMMGLPGSGKSTLAKNICEKYPNIKYISRDEIRFSLLDSAIDPTVEYFSYEKEVFEIFVNSIKAQLENNKTVMADATFLNNKSRQKLLQKINPKNKYLIFAKTPLRVCLERNSKRKGRERVPEETIRSMMNRIDNKDFSTFNAVITYYGEDAERGTTL